MEHKLKVYSEDEIEAIINGEPKDVYRVLLKGISSINDAVIPHLREEEKVFAAFGDPGMIKLRSEWITEQIAKQKNRNEMMQKIGQASAVGAILLLIGWVATTAASAALAALKSAIVGLPK